MKLCLKLLTNHITSIFIPGLPSNNYQPNIK